MENGVITKWDVTYAPSRKYATDMAGFAVNLNLILTKKYVSKVLSCEKGNKKLILVKEFHQHFFS